MSEIGDRLGRLSDEGKELREDLAELVARATRLRERIGRIEGDGGSIRDMREADLVEAEKAIQRTRTRLFQLALEHDRAAAGTGSRYRFPELGEAKQAAEFIAGQQPQAPTTDSFGDPDGGSPSGDTDSFGNPIGPAPARPATKPATATTSGTASSPSATATADPSTGGGVDTSAEGKGTPNPDGLFGVPGGAQVWEAPDNYWYVVYTVPGTNPPVPLAWRIENDDDVAAIFGPGNTPTPHRTLSAEEWASAGVLTFGPSRMLANLSEHPFDAFVSNFETEARIRPWLRDPEILALTTKAILEGREVSEAELAGTRWWQSHTDAERSWIAEYNRDPATAKQKVQDGRDRVRELMITLGVSDPPEQLVQLIGDRLTGGTWTEQYVNNQISKLADPGAPGTLDGTLQQWVTDLQTQGVTLNTLADNTSKIDSLVRTWIGPAHAKSISEEKRQQWAGRLRNDPNAEEEIVNELKRKRLALFPEYEDPELSYEDIASTWRGVVTSEWGQHLDEADPLFTRIVRMNDLSGAEQVLRSEGLQRNVGRVVDRALQDLAASPLGAGVRGAI